MSSSFSSLSSSLIQRAVARQHRSRPWLTSTVAPAVGGETAPVSRHLIVKPTATSSSSTTIGRKTAPVSRPRKVTPMSTSSFSALPSTVVGRVTARVLCSRQTTPTSLNFRSVSSRSVNSSTVSGLRQKTPVRVLSKPIATAVIKPKTTAAWVESQRQALRHLPKPKNINPWLRSQAISPPPSSSSTTRHPSSTRRTSSTWGRKSSANYPRLLRQVIANIQPPPRHKSFARPTSSTGARKSSANHSRLLLQASAGLQQRPALPSSSFLPSQADETDNSIAAIVAAAERFDINKFRQEWDHDVIRLQENMRKFRIELGLEPSRKKVTFSDEVTVKTVPKWIGVTGPKSEHVHPDMSHLIGELAGWRSTEDPYSPIILLGGTFKRDYDHSDCPNPDCHYRLDDLYMGNNMEEWTIRSLSTISDNE